MGNVITLYHFCCAEDMPGIRSQGITKGVIVGERQSASGRWVRVEFPGYQWMTYDRNRDRQSWATMKLIKYSRTEYRFTVEIPEKEVSQLYDRDRLSEQIPGSEKLFDGWAGSENWVVYRGKVPKYWLKKLEHWNKETQQWEEVELR